MRAVWLENQALSLRDDIPEPVPAPGEALIRLSLAGICSTDLELVKGYYPYGGILGHEFVGEVVASSADESWVGARVVGEINIVCGQCRACRSGRSTHCEQRSVLGIKNKAGAFSQFFTLPLANLHRVPDSVPDELAVFTEPLAAALQIQAQVHIQPQDHVLLVGAGRLGLLIAQSLALLGCELNVLVRRDRPRNILQSHRIACIGEDQVKPGAWDIVIEASGSPGGFEIARRAVRTGGIIVLKSTYVGDLKIHMSSIVVDEISLIGSRCGPFAPALRILEKGLVDPSALIEEIYPLEDGVAAFQHAARPGALKILLRP
jgi:threonine dehydrogenase-like Zn-dependent dehydrogenase